MINENIPENLKDFYKYYTMAETVDYIESLSTNKFSLKVRDGYNGESKTYMEMTTREFTDFMKGLEKILNTGTYLNAFRTKDEEKIISMMRMLQILRMSDAYWGIETDIDYKRLRKDIEAHKLESKFVNYLKEHQFEGYVLTGLLESGMLQEYAKDRKTFEAITSNIDFAQLITGIHEFDDRTNTDIVLEGMIDSKVILDICKRNLINRERATSVLLELLEKQAITKSQVLETLGIKNIADMYIDFKDGKGKIDRGIDTKTFYSLIQEKDIYKLFMSTKKSKYLELIPAKNIIDRYIIDNILDDGIIGANSEDIKLDMTIINNASHITPETILEYFERIDRGQYDRIKPEHVIELLTRKDFPKRLIPKSNDLYEIYEVGGLLTEKDMLKLAIGNGLDDKTLLEVYIRQEKLKEIYKSKKLFPDGTDITVEEFLNYFNIEKSLDMIKNEANGRRFIEHYKKVLSSLNSDERSNIERTLVEQIYIQNRDNEDIGLIETLKLFYEGVIESPEVIQDKIDADKIVEIFTRSDLIDRLLDSKKVLPEEQEEEKDSILSKLYKTKIIDIEVLGLIYLENDKYKEDEAFQIKMLDQYTKDNLGVDIFQYIDKSTINKQIQAGEILQSKILEMFEQGIIDIDSVKTASIEDISQYITEGYKEDKLKELYKYEVLTFEGLKALNENGIIIGDWNKICEEYNRLRDVTSEMRRFIKSGDIINTSQDIPSEKGKTHSISEGIDRSQVYRTTISSDIRENFFDDLGCIRYGYEDDNGVARYFTRAQKELLSRLEQEGLEEHRLKREILESKSLSGYEVVLIPDLDIAILEKKKEGNATYIMNLHNAFEKMKYDTKKDLQEDSTVVRVNHTKGWGKNVIIAMAGINGFDKKELIKKHEDAIVRTVEDYEINREIRDEQKLTRGEI